MTISVRWKWKSPVRAAPCLETACKLVISDSEVKCFGNWIETLKACREVKTWQLQWCLVNESLQDSKVKKKSHSCRKRAADLFPLLWPFSLCFFSLLYTILMWEALRGCRLQHYMKNTVSRICGIDSMFSFVICPCRGKNIEIMHVYLCRIWSKVLVLAVAVCSWRQWFIHTVFSPEMKNKNSH